ncbi:MAG: hypothetical protein U5J96_12475 [Ignavibacteriaceae bacterium]|nr:hypothetical protein [Ignavibacteriaceae bacterium]
MRLNLTLTGDPTQIDAVGRNVNVPPSGLENPDVYLQNINQGGYNISLNGVYSIGQSLIINGVIARVYRQETSEPATERGNEIRYEDGDQPHLGWWCRRHWGHTQVQ